MNNLLCSIRLFVLSIAVCSAAYSALILGLASVVAPESSKGSLISRSDGTVVGSELLAQGFTRPEYVWPRPSACDYNASATAGSNLSPTNTKITDRAKEIISRLQPSEGQLVPADLVLASGGGMDPHISLAGAMFQVSRVAAARGVNPDEVESLIRRSTDSPTLQFLGDEPLVNVLKLNLALDEMGK